MTAKRIVATVGVGLVLTLGLAACSPGEPPRPAVPSSSAAAADPEFQIVTAYGQPPLDTRGVEASDEQKAAFQEDVANQPDISSRVATEGLDENFAWNLAYIGATAPAEAITDEVRNADLTGFASTPNLLDGLEGSAFAAWVAEESGIPEDSIYFHVPLHAAQLGVKHFG